jgi:hypothetical protein
MIRIVTVVMYMLVNGAVLYRDLDSIVIDVIGVIGIHTFGYYLSVFTNVPPPPKPHM